MARSLWIIDEGADYNAEPYALVKAAHTDKNVAVTKKLLEKGAGKVAAKGGDGATMATLALENACDNTGHTTETIDALIAHGANVNGTKADHSRSLVAYMATCVGTIESLALPAIATLLKHGADVNGTFGGHYSIRHVGVQRTALGHAMYYHADDIGMLLLDNGAYINARDSDGKSVLDLAKAAGLITSSVPKSLKRLKEKHAV